MALNPQDGALSWAKEWKFSSHQAGGYGPEGNTEGSLITALNGTKLLFAHPTTYSLQVGGGRDNLTVSESNGAAQRPPSHVPCLYSRALHPPVTCLLAILGQVVLFCLLMTL